MQTTTCGERIRAPRPGRAAGAVACFAGLVGWACSAPVLGIDEFQQRASWHPPAAAEVRVELDRWLETRDIDPQTRDSVAAIWNSAEEAPDPPRLLDQLIATVALVHPAARQLAAVSASPLAPASGADVEWLDSEELPDLVRYNFRLAYGRWLAQQAYYDEALQQIGDLNHQDVVDPATLLFYQGVAHHRLLHRERCLDCIARLLQRAEEIPRRYVSLARLMAADIEPLKQDSLDEVSRLMEDIQRRLRFARAGTRVRKEEDDVIAKLDKMIKKLEQQQQQQSGGGGQGSSRSSSPAQDSVPLGGSGPGDVDPRPIGKGSDWGNLPPKKRQEALQQISKDLPSHYREVIEEYFRRLARDEGR